VNNYVRLRFREASGRTVSCWAIKLGPVSYRRVNNEGDWGVDGSTTLIVVTPADVVSEKPADVSRRYGTMEVLNGRPFVP
jgi:hypothetical protein